MTQRKRAARTIAAFGLLAALAIPLAHAATKTPLDLATEAAKKYAEDHSSKFAFISPEPTGGKFYSAEMTVGEGTSAWTQAYYCKAYVKQASTRESTATTEDAAYCVLQVAPQVPSSSTTTGE